jgi:DNA-binding response OmpR family regulator
MKPRLVLLYTHDPNFDRVLSEALSGAGAIVLIARSVGDALQVVSSRGRDLDFAILDFNDGCRGMTLLSAIHTCHQQLPTLVVTSKDLEHAGIVARANGARAYLNKPVPSARLASAISEVMAPNQHMVAA